MYGGLKNSLFCFALTVLTCMIFSSCSIEKRRYMSGWNIDWRHSQNRYPKAEKPSGSDLRFTASADPVTSKEISLQRKEIPEEIQSQNYPSRLTRKKLKAAFRNALSLPDSARAYNSSPNAQSPKIIPMAKGAEESLICGIVAIVGLLCSLFLPSLVILAIVASILAIAFGIKAKNELKRNRNLEGSGHAQFGLTTGATILVLILLSLLLYVILVLAFWGGLF